MAKESAHKREAILSAFDEIPAIFAMAAEKRNHFPANEQLRECSITLHATLMWAISQLIAYLLPESRGKSN